MLKPKLGLSTLIASCTALSAAIAADSPARDVAVAAQQVQRMDIKVAPVRPTTTQAVVQLPGTVVPALDARLVAAAPFAGTVLQLHVLPGQTVTKGMPLATISSREVLDTLSQVAQAQAELQMAEATARRKRSLADKAIQSPTLAEEAEAQVVKIKAVLEQHRRALTIGGITVSDGGRYAITAPADGRVVDTPAMPGEKLDAMTAAVTLDTSGELWIEVQVPADVAARIKPGDAIQVIDGPEGKVLSIAVTLDKLTRSARMLASVPAGSALMAGQMVVLSVMQDAAAGSLSVPASAVARIKDQHGVFVRTETGFALVAVTVAGRSRDDVTILGDVPKDAQVAASGLPQLEQILGDE
ncbi:MAG: efflux RND transporter periplasmic adaptor subunit [Hyphomicrobium sp.]